MPTATIHLERNRVVVKGYVTEKGNGWLPNYLRVFDTMTKRYDKDKTYSYLMSDGTIIFPRTVNVKSISQRLYSQGYDIEGIYDETNENVIEYRTFKTQVKLKDGVTPRDQFQVEGIHHLTRNFGNMHYRLLSLPTGNGKTFCAMAAMCKYGRKTLIVANALCSQWVDEILDKTTVQYNRIYEIKDGIDSIEKLVKSSVRPESYDVFVASLKTLLNAVESGVYYEFCKKFGIGLKIVDEIHIATYSHVFLDMMAPIQDTLYLSATLARSNPNEDYCMKKAFAELPQYGQEVREFQTKYLNTIYVFYDTHPKYYEIKSCTSFYGFNTKNYAKHLFENPDACNQVLSILQWALETTLQAIDDDEKIVIILELKDHIKLVKRELERLFPGVSIGDYSSNVDKSVKSDMLRNKIILSTDKSFGTGADLRGKLRVLINTITYSSKVTANQLPGRLRNIPNKKVYYIDLVNMGFKRVYDHYFRRSKIINKFSLTVQHRTLGKDI